MLVSGDRVCVLGFPTREVQDAGAAGIYLSALDGDYELAFDPLSGPATMLNSLGVQARASRRTNVRVELPSGKLLADPGATIATSTSKVLDTTTPCAAISSSVVRGAKILRRTVSCLWVRVLLWAWDQHKGTAVLTKGTEHRERRILGWRCQVSQPVATRFLTFTCRKGPQLVKAEI
jgi:hypothetical protein